MSGFSIGLGVLLLVILAENGRTTAQLSPTPPKTTTTTMAANVPDGVAASLMPSASSNDTLPKTVAPQQPSTVGITQGNSANEDASGSSSTTTLPPRQPTTNLFASSSTTPGQGNGAPDPANGTRDSATNPQVPPSGASGFQTNGASAQLPATSTVAASPAAPASSFDIPSTAVNGLKPLPVTPAQTSSTPAPIGLNSAVSGVNTPSPPVNAIWRAQVMLANDYQEMLNASRLSAQDYVTKLNDGVAELCGIESFRIVDASVVPNPDTGRMVLRFEIRPVTIEMSSQRGFNVTPPMVVERIRNLVESNSFNLTDASRQILYVDISRTAFYAWNENGMCPNETCPADQKCQCRPNGEFYCQCTSNCPTAPPPPSPSPEYVEVRKPANNNLWWLMVIPGVIIIALIILLIVLLYQRRHWFEQLRRLRSRKTVRNYKPAYDIGTIVDNPMMATQDPGAANRLYKTLGRNLGLAFNDKTFIESDKDSSTVSSVDSGIIPM